MLHRDSSEGELGEVLDCLIERRGGEMDELVALAVVDTLWERLEGLRVARDGLGAFHSLIGGEGGGWGLVEQLLGEVYRKEGGDVNGLHHHSQGLGAMLRSGLGWLGSAPSAPHPRQFLIEKFICSTFPSQGGPACNSLGYWRRNSW